MVSKCLRNLTRLAIAPAAVLVLPAAVTAGGPFDFGGYRPHYQGYGVETPGGRGGIVNRVTNLSDSGAGSFRAAVAARAGCVNTSATCARFVVFETSGYIPLSSSVIIDSPYLTIAGQTAPSPGISIRNKDIRIDTHDVVMQHLRIRQGDTNGCGGLSALYIRNNAPFNVVLDHISVSWSCSTAISINSWSGPQPEGVTIVDSIIAEPLRENSGLQNPISGSHAGVIWVGGANCTGTFVRNLVVHASHRTPWVSVGCRFVGFNNVAYNASAGPNNDGVGGFVQLCCNESFFPPTPLEAVWIGNIMRAGPNTLPETLPIAVFLAPRYEVGSQIYLSDNSGINITLENQWGGVNFCDASCSDSGKTPNAATEANIKLTTLPSWFTAFNYNIMANASVQASVLAHAGARPLDRDAVDTRVVADVTQLDGSWIDTPAQVGGFPTLAVNRQTYNVPTNPNNPGTCGTTTTGVARAILECDLEAKARALEPATLGQATPSPPRNPRLVR